MGWTHQELMEQPVSFVESILDIIQVENKFLMKNGRR
jgi:hypothetical protein